jgi:hypothetical protein
MMTASFTASVTVNAPPIASPEKVRALIHGEFKMVAVPVSLKFVVCESVSIIVGAIGKGFEVEFNVPLKVPSSETVGDAVQVPASPRLSVKVPARFIPVAVPTIVTVSVPVVLGKEIINVTSAPFTVPLGVIEITEGLPPSHCDKSFEGHTSVLAAPVNVLPVCVKFV